jgi:uncharacterized protein involved in exopolysaccharide biosynthesis
MNWKNESSFDQQQDGLDIKEIIFKILRRWPLLLLSLLTFSSIAYLFLRSRMNIYQTAAIVLVKDPSSGAVPTETSIFEDLGIFPSNTNLFNEVEILKSRVLLAEVVKALGINIQYTQKRSFFESDIDLYGKNNPLKIVFKEGDSVSWTGKGVLKVEIKDKFSFTAFEENDEQEFVKLGSFKFEQWLETKMGTVKLSKTHAFNNNFIKAAIEIRCNNLNISSNNLKSKLVVEPVKSEATALNVSIKGSSADENEDIINTLIAEHERQTVKDKNQISLNTSEFIEDRMSIIQEELRGVELTGEEFKSSRGLVDVQANAIQYLEKSGQIESELWRYEVQNNLAKYMLEYLNNTTNNKNSPNENYAREFFELFTIG